MLGLLFTVSCFRAYSDKKMLEIILSLSFNVAVNVVLGISKPLASSALFVPWTKQCHSFSIIIMGYRFLCLTIYALFHKDCRSSWLQLQQSIILYNKIHVTICLHCCWWRNPSKPVSCEISDFMMCAHAQVNILHMKYTQKTDNYGLGFGKCVGLGFGLGLVKKIIELKTESNIFQWL